MLLLFYKNINKLFNRNLGTKNEFKGQSNYPFVKLVQIIIILWLLN